MRKIHAIARPDAARCVRAALAAGMLVGMSACATYHAMPLNDSQGTTAISNAPVSAAHMPTMPLRNHAFDPSDGLDITEVAMLAVANSPHLKAMRDQLGVSRAQAFDAGLLPDPQFSLGGDFPTGGGSGLTSAFSLGLNYDLGALLTRSARVSGAEASVQKACLDLLWAEWQSIARARLLFDQVRYQQFLQRRLQRELNAIKPLAAQISKALARGDLDYAAANTGIDAAANIRKQLGSVSLKQQQARSDLRQLLGLAADTELVLAGATSQLPPSDTQIDLALTQLVARRPDLLALKAGYAAQEADVRTAILGQFPAIQIGVNRARDTSAVYTTGFSIGITLPLFNRNRGKIAIARATRQQLADSYRERLLATRNDVHRLREALRTIDRQQAAVDRHARTLDTTAKTATRNWRNGLLDWPTWLSIRSSALGADMDRYDLRQQRSKTMIALDTLLGADWSDRKQGREALHKNTETGP